MSPLAGLRKSLLLSRKDLPLAEESVQGIGWNESRGASALVAPWVTSVGAQGRAPPSPPAGRGRPRQLLGRDPERRSSELSASVSALRTLSGGYIPAVQGCPVHGRGLAAFLGYARFREAGAVFRRCPLSPGGGASHPHAESHPPSYRRQRGSV